MKRTQNNKYYLGASVSLITFAIYLSCLHHEFVEWDDSVYVFENPHIRSFDMSFLKWAFTGFHAGNWHPPESFPSEKKDPRQVYDPWVTTHRAGMTKVC